MDEGHVRDAQVERGRFGYDQAEMLRRLSAQVAPADGAVEATPTLTPLDDARAAIDKELEGLASLIGQFFDAVYDVLAPIVVADPADDVASYGSSPLLVWLTSVSNRVGQMSRQLRIHTNAAETGHHTRF